jgi:hypothetical protein
MKIFHVLHYPVIFSYDEMSLNTEYMLHPQSERLFSDPCEMNKIIVFVCHSDKKHEGKSYLPSCLKLVWFSSINS